MAKNVIMPFL